MWTVGDAGWNALIRAAFTVLSPMQCERQARPFRVTQVKEKAGRLVVNGRGFDPFRSHDSVDSSVGSLKLEA